MEFSLAFLIWFRATRPIVICLGLMLHSGITLTINIPIFGELMWLGYLAFLTPPEFQALIRAIDVRRWFARSKAIEDAAPASVPIPVMPPSFRASTIVVRLDPGAAFAGPHRIDVAPSRLPVEIVGAASD